MRWWHRLRESWPLWGLVAFWLIFPLALIWTATKTDLRCERQAARPLCTLETFHDLRASTQITFPPGELLGAEVEESADSDGNTTYRLVLLLERGPLPFSPTFTGGYAEKQANAEAVRQFVANRAQPSLFITQDQRLTNYLIAAGLVAFLVIAVVVIFRN